jgi:hypothetical protein
MSRGENKLIPTMTRSLTLPSGIPIDMVERDGWAIVSPRGFEVEAVDPTPLFAPLPG